MNSNDWVKTLLNKPLDAIPGGRYNFNSGSSMILSKIIQNLTNETLSSYIARRLFKALEIEEWLWTTDPSGTTNATNGLYLTQLDFTKIGYLLIKNGVWKDQVILSDAWIHESTDVQHQPSYSYSLGYLWFQFTQEQGNAPYNSKRTFYIPGQTGYHLYINPEEKLVVSVGAKNYFYGFFGPSYWLYFAIMDLHQDYL
jgi:CubicO group peptidase (beta-lactamase class C family)